MKGTRWFRIGPGLVLTIVASLLLWRQLPPRRNGRVDPPRIERTRVDAVLDAPLSAPDPEWLLAQRDTLRLSTAQVQKLVKLQGRWNRDTRELREALARISDQFNREMGTGGGRGVTMKALRERAAPISSLSRQLADARQAWWGEAAAVLTPAQQRRAEQAWAKRLLTKPHQK